MAPDGRGEQELERATLAREAAAYVIGTNNVIFLALFFILANILPFQAL